LQCKKLEHWWSGAVEGGGNANYCSTDLFSIFDSIRILLCINLVSIRALDFGTIDNAKNAIHSSTVLLSVSILACYLHSNILVTNEALNMATMGNTMIAAPFDSQATGRSLMASHLISSSAFTLYKSPFLVQLDSVLHDSMNCKTTERRSHV